MQNKKGKLMILIILCKPQLSRLSIFKFTLENEIKGKIQEKVII